MTGGRQAAEQFGRRAESVAALWLFLKGYRILARRAQTGVGELDLVARRGGVLAIVEVKARPNLRLGLEAISWQQKQRIMRGASGFVSRRRELAGLAIRYDLIVIRPWRLPHHERQFFWPEGRAAMDFN
ncbi:YraN family protein [Hyphobacterium sp.]|jgi:putative endonuclease|uniref:YraN family protein n=1 Tax=Hyphobacterium sp. TaxID=2004662 RepID=UPI003BAA1565